MSGLSKLGAALTVIFVISLVALLAELFYVLWRRRVFHRQSPVPATLQGTTAAHSNSQTFSDSSSNFTSLSSSSKELLYYFFCLNNTSQISRVEPISTPPSLNSTEDDEMEVIDVFKLQNMYGPSRVLFTIKEEDRENDVESEKSLCSSAEKGNTMKHNTTTSKKRVVNLEECFKAADNESTGEEAVAVGDDHSNNNMGDQIAVMTPFSTPCESPAYLTPSASPIREPVDSGQVGTGLCSVQTIIKVEVFRGMENS